MLSTSKKDTARPGDTKHPAPLTKRKQLTGHTPETGAL